MLGVGGTAGSLIQGGLMAGGTAAFLDSFSQKGVRGWAEAIGGGAAIGAAIGSVVPVIGTAIGAAIGAAAGALAKGIQALIAPRDQGEERISGGSDGTRAGLRRHGLVFPGRLQEVARRRGNLRREPGLPHPQGHRIELEVPGRSGRAAGCGTGQNAGFPEISRSGQDGVGNVRFSGSSTNWANLLETGRPSTRLSRPLSRTLRP